MTQEARREALAQTLRIAEREPQAYTGLIHLRERMKAAGMSQAGMARVLMRPRTTIDNWCTGRCCPLAVDLPSIARLLGCTIAELFLPPEEDELDELEAEPWPE